MGFEEMEKLGYKQLKDLSFEFDANKSSFVLCFWVYLPKSTPFPCTILHQLHSGKPFLGLGEDKRLMLSPSFLFPQEATDMNTIVPCTTAAVEFPLNRWVHLGCEVSSNIIRIHQDGKVVGETILSSSPAKEVDFHDSMRYTLSAKHKGFEGLDGYAYNAEFLPSTFSMKSHYVKDPPVRLCFYSSSASDIERERNGTWNIVGGKVSCRKTFSLDILLLDPFDRPVDKELKVGASLVYADDESPVEKSEDNEAPLLAICDGREFSSADTPSTLFQGRASFRMKISQLSSKCNNKLFCIKFNVRPMENCPFLKAFTPPIRCISRICNTSVSTITWKKLPSGVHLFNGSSSPQYGVGQSELQQKAFCEVRPNPSKRVRFEQDDPVHVIKADSSVKQCDEECNSFRVPENKVQSAVGTSLEALQENYGDTDTSASDSESTESDNSELKNIPSREELLSDMKIFKYCLGGLSERSAMLKEISVFVSEQDIAELAEKVSFFSGCTHHRHQIMIAKGLLVEGETVWNMISRDSHRVQWDDVVFEIEEHFMRISCCSTRSLTQQDLNFLRRISGGQEYMTRDDFDRMWNWLYPIAFTISRQEINALWTSTSPKWIEGFVTKEEVECALQSPLGISEPGTFILRFPTTRSWPHPDAGSLVATYVGRDYSLHHRLLSLDYSSGMFGTNSKPLQELLLSEPELSQVGRITRSNLAV